MRESGWVHEFEVLDRARFIHAALSIPQARHFAANGSEPPDRWPGNLAAFAERPDVNRHETHLPHNYGFRVDDDSRSAISALLCDPSSCEVWCAYHLWVYSDEVMLVSCYDWPSGPNFAALELTGWLESLATESIIAVVGKSEFTDEWFERMSADDF